MRSVLFVVCHLLCGICCVLSRLTDFLPSFLSNISAVTESGK